jgi:hypothetical protein
MRILIESLVVGLAVLVLGLILHVVLGHHALHSSSPKMKEEMIRLSVLLFLTGFLLHLLGKKWYMKYCKH